METVLTVLFVYAALAALMYLGGRFVHGYAYTDIPESLIWRAPAAAGVVWFVGLVWPLLFQRMTKAVWPVSFNQLFLYTTGEVTPKVDAFIVPDERNRPVTYSRIDYPQERFEYRVDRSPEGRPLPELARLPQQLKVITAAKETLTLERQEKGSRLRYVDADGRVMDEDGFGRLASASTGVGFLKFIAGLLTFAAWFGSLWLLLQFQWQHALGLSIPLYLVWGFLLNVPFSG